MQWGAMRPIHDSANPIIPEAKTVVPVIVPEETISGEESMMEDTSNIDTSTPAETVSTQPVTTNTALDPNLPKNPTDKVIRYDSSRFKYGFEMPANVYYSAFPAESDAIHTVGIGKEDPATLAEAAVRVYFYGKKVLPELQNSPKYMSPDGTSVYLLVNGASIKIEALNINHPVVQKIIETFTVQ